jgi:integrase
MRRPKYVDRIGVRRGSRGDTVWVKVQLPHGGSWDENQYPPGSAAEIKLGRLTSITWDEAVTKRDQLQRRADRGEPLQDQPVTTFATWADDWLARKKGVLRCWEREVTHLRVHLTPIFGTKRLDAITTTDIERWIAAKREDGLAAGYIKRLMNTLKAVMNDAVRSGAIAENPAAHANQIRDAAARERFLEAAEIVGLLAVADQIERWLYDAILWALHSGMRRGEIQRLRWQDVRTIDDGGAIVLLERTKSGKPRSVICTRTMIEVLDRQKARRIDGDDRVWPVSAMTWRRRWEKAREAAGLPDVDFHDLRRTKATMAAIAGVDLRTLAARLGHSDLTMLEKHYAMVKGSAAHEAAEKIQRTFDGMTANVVALKSAR